MAESTDVHQLKTTIKGIMRKKGHKYEDLAKALGVSVNTVKRVLNKEDLSVQRLHDILKWLGVSLAEVATLNEELGRLVFSRLTEQQERFLAQNTAHYFIFEELTVGSSIKQVQKKFNLNDQSMQRYLLELDQQNILELHANGRVRMLVKGLIARRGGSVCQLLSDKLAPIVKEYTELGLLFGKKLPTFNMEFNTNLRLRPKTLDELHNEVDELVVKYTNIGAMEAAVENSEDLTPVVWFFMVKNSEINDRLFETPSNFPDTLGSPLDAQL